MPREHLSEQSDAPELFGVRVRPNGPLALMNEPSEGEYSQRALANNALVVLADTVLRYAHGHASWSEVEIDATSLLRCAEAVKVRGTHDWLRIPNAF